MGGTTEADFKFVGTPGRDPLAVTVVVSNRKPTTKRTDADDMWCALDISATTRTARVVLGVRNCVKVSDSVNDFRRTRRVAAEKDEVRIFWVSLYFKCL